VSDLSPSGTTPRDITGRDISRRDALSILGGIAMAGVLGVPPAVVERIARNVQRAKEGPAPYDPQFFTPHEWQTVRVLADLVIPADERSGGATDAGVPEFMDFMLMERESMQTPMRDGLRWLDEESRSRFGADFVDLTATQQAEILDDVAWPSRARPEMGPGVEFFTLFRDLTASGFFSSKMGVEDIGYMGNRWVTEWTGCPDEALRRLDVSYDLMGGDG
jgi:gluconate 2-dehydrogenase gamma chain